MSIRAALTAKTRETRSGDRVRNGMIIAGASSTGIAIILDPYITAWMKHQTGAYGIVFTDPDGWKNAVVQVSILVATAAWGVLHMHLIRYADRLAPAADGEPPAAQVEP